MKSLSCYFERVSNLGAGLFLLLLGLAFVVIGITVLPVLGFIVAIPIFLGSFYFLRAHLSDECQLRD